MIWKEEHINSRSRVLCRFLSIILKSHVLIARLPNGLAGWHDAWTNCFAVADSGASTVTYWIFSPMPVWAQANVNEIQMALLLYRFTIVSIYLNCAAST